MSLSAKNCCAFVLVCLSLCFKAQESRAQDSTQIAFREEMDTLVKMRYVDRYENVFMTKVPTRHMFRVGIVQSFMALDRTILEEDPTDNNFLHIGYEFKLLKSVAIGVAANFPNYLKYHYGSRIYFRDLSVYEGQIKWFPGMNKRIRKGLGAGNFSGKYLALNVMASGFFVDGPRLGLKFGYQQRFLNRGFLDFAVTLQRPQSGFSNPMEDFQLMTTASYGFAFGDWKRNNLPPLCEILMCDEFSRDQFKIRFPDIVLGRYESRIRWGTGYEYKFGGSPWSLHTHLDISVGKGYRILQKVYDVPGSGGGYYWDGRGISRELSLGLSIQPRYYLLQRLRRLKGKGGNGFSGVYAGLNTGFQYLAGRHGFYFTDSKLNILHRIVETGPLAGFQQRVFKHGYVDFNTSYNLQRELSEGVNSSGFRVNLGVGFSL